MEIEKIKKYIGKKVLLVLKNNYKFTIIVPEFEGESFSVKDKYNNDITIECDMVSLIVEQNNGGDL